MHIFCIVYILYIPPIAMWYSTLIYFFTYSVKQKNSYKIRSMNIEYIINNYIIHVCYYIFGKHNIFIY